MARRPLIMVTGPDRGGTVAWVFTALAVWRAGGRPRRVTPSRPPRSEEMDALLIGGGADVDPAHYGEGHLVRRPAAKDPRLGWGQRVLDWTLSPAIYLMRLLFSRKAGVERDTARDRLELDLLERAVRRRIPVLGICRGAQLINVYFDGDLHQDLSSYYSEMPEMQTVLPRKRIDVDPHSHLGTALALEHCRVNALHRQGVRRLGEGLRVVARDDNGIIQAIEHAGHRFVVGTQWHPEYLPQRRSQQRLFDALVDAAREVA